MVLDCNLTGTRTVQIDRRNNKLLRKREIMMGQSRDPERIRNDAIRMAMKKAHSGCLPCVRSYLELAKQHGATEEEFRRAIEAASVTSAKGVSRRTLLKLALGVAAGLTLSLPELLAGPVRADSSFWGTDTNSATCCGLPQDLYLGPLGGGTSTGNTDNFNTGAAQAAGSNSTYAYWDVWGPKASPYNPYLWGAAQGQVAADEWQNNPNASYVGGMTIFGDIEPGNPGWDSDQSSNQAVLHGFLDELQSAGFTPGIYISPANWQNFFGGTYAPPQTFVLWITGDQTCTIDCAPCASCTDTMSQVEILLPTISQISLGGSAAVVWQYWISDCGCGDFNATLQNPSLGFTPVGP